VVVAWCVALVAALLWPIAGSGYLLGHDMVFTPDQPLDLASLGLSSAAPRAVPLDALVALAGRIVGGALVGRVAVLLPVIMAGIGTARLLGSRSTAARLAAAGLAIWNPYVVERLDIGQWALLWSYAAIPWIWVAILSTRSRFARVFAMAAASITPTGGLIAVGTAIAAVCSKRARAQAEVMWTIAAAAVLQLPWILPAVLSSASATSDPAGVHLFRARAEHAGGPLLSLLGGGGIWDAEVVPASRSGAPAWIGLAVLVAVVLVGAPRLVTLLGRGPVTGLAALAAVGLGLALVSSVPGGAALVEHLVAHAPGAGLLRDAQKWIAALVIFEALLFGAAIDRLTRPDSVRRTLLVVVACAVPIAVLPDAPSTLRTVFTPVHYPSDWARVADDVRGRGTVAVTPDGSYRTFTWVPGRSVIDPAPRLLPTTVVVDDRLTVGGRTLAGEDLRAAAVQTALAEGGAALSRLGVSWVLVELGPPGAVANLTGLTLVYRGPDIALYRTPSPVARTPGWDASDTTVLIVDLGIAAGLVGLAGWAGWTGAPMIRRRRRPRRSQVSSG
jgi:hypothetical protein